MEMLAFMDYIRDRKEIYWFDGRDRPLHGKTEIEMSQMYSDH
jgi:hypothetical protein